MWGRLAPVCDDGEEPGHREAVITRKSPCESARTGSGAEDCHGQDKSGSAHHGDQCTRASVCLLEGLDDGVAGGEAVAEDSFSVNDEVEYHYDVGEAANAVDDDGSDNCAGNVDGRVPRFFGHVDNCVDAGQGEGRGEQTETEAYPVAGSATGIDKRCPDCPIVSLFAGDKDGDCDNQEENAAISTSQNTPAIIVIQALTRASFQPKIPIGAAMPCQRYIPGRRVLQLLSSTKLCAISRERMLDC